MKSRSIVGVGMIAVLLAAPFGFGAAGDKPDAPSQEIRLIAGKYRAARTLPRRAAVLKELAALGPEGVAAAKNLLAQELKLATAGIAGPSKTAALEEQVAGLRKVLADLRKDPELSKEQLEKIGLPALDQLTRLYRLASVQGAPRKAKMARAAAQLDQFTATLDLLRKEWKQNPPLPLDVFAQEAKKLAAEMLSPEEQVSRKVAEANAPLAARLDRDVVAGMEDVNAMRVMCGLRPLVYDLKLCEAARGHSGDMQAGNFFAHESPLPGKKTPFDRAKLAGTTASGENIFKGSAVSKEAIKGWFLSPGHHKNMLRDNIGRQGLGRAGDYWTQLFGE